MLKRVRQLEHQIERDTLSSDNLKNKMGEMAHDLQQECEQNRNLETEC